MAELHLLGTILGASDFAEAGGLYCRFHIESGNPPDLETEDSTTSATTTSKSSTSSSYAASGGSWQILSGEASGTTHADASTEVGQDAVFDHPIDLHYGCCTCVGWPRIRIEVWGRDSNGSNSLCGYGFAHIPMRPGKHHLDIVTWRPEGSFAESLHSFFLGDRPQLKNPAIVANTFGGKGRYGLKGVSGGIVYVSVDVIASGFEKFGVFV
jgi:B9 domain-containing protein 2